MKKVLALVMSILMILGSFTGCSSSLSTTQVSKGEFYSLLISKFNYYPLNNSVEEMESADNYKIEAQTMVDWFLLPEEIALKNIDKPIAKEEAALACLNTLSVKKTGKIEDIKDAKLCDYPQEMADAVANGIIVLDNGYIDGKKAISEETCLQMFNATKTAAANNVFDEDEAVSGFNDDCFVVTGDDLIDVKENEFIIEGYDSASEAANAKAESTIEGLSNNNSTDATVQPLVLKTKADTNIVNLENGIETTTFSIYISKKFYEKTIKGCKIGQLVTYAGNELNKYSSINNNFNSVDGNDLMSDYRNGVVNKVRPFAGRLVKVIDWEEKKACPIGWTSLDPCVQLVLESLNDREIMENTEIEGLTRKVKFTEFEQLESDIGGFKIEISTIDSSGKETNKGTESTGLKLTVSKQFHLSGNEYNNWRDWTADPTAEFSFSVNNITLTTNNLQNLYKKNNKTGSLRLTCDTTEEIILKSGGLRVTPDSNRNGKFFSNLTNSRLTNGDGTSSIKVAKLKPIRLGKTGLSLEIGVYLVIGLDGKIDITLSQLGNGFEIKKASNGKLVVDRVGTNELYGEINVNANLELKSVADLKFFLIKRAIITGDLAMGANINAVMNVYAKEKEKGKTPSPVASGYGDPEEALAAMKQFFPDTHFCVDCTVKTYVRGGLLTENERKEKNVIGAFASELGFDITKWKFEFNCEEDSWIKMPKFHFHFEDGAFIDKCTINHSEENDKKGTKDDTFTLNQTKLVMPDNVCGIVYVVDSPITDKEIKKNKGIKVKSKDESIAKVIYNETNKSIMVEAVAPGSTEIEVYIKKDKKSDKKYTQVFSVTINETVNVEGMSFTIPDYSTFTAQGKIYAA